MSSLIKWAIFAVALAIFGLSMSTKLDEGWPHTAAFIRGLLDTAFYLSAVYSGWVARGYNK